MTDSTPLVIKKNRYWPGFVIAALVAAIALVFAVAWSKGGKQVAEATYEDIRQRASSLTGPSIESASTEQLRAEIERRTREAARPPAPTPPPPAPAGQQQTLPETLSQRYTCADGKPGVWTGGKVDDTVEPSSTDGTIIVVKRVVETRWDCRPGRP